jgi:CHASE2 domain-containing sensor protein
VVAAIGTYVSQGRTVADGLLFDLAIAARSELFGPTGEWRPSPVAVIALDQRSLDADELVSYPRALFGPVWSRLVPTLMNAGAKAVVFDLLLSYDASAFKAGFDRRFRAALSKYRDRIVLGRSATTLPAKPYLAALEMDERSLGLLELTRDGDGVYPRHTPRPRLFAPDAKQNPDKKCRWTLPGCCLDRCVGSRTRLTR